jgi:hypothetical protein
MNVQMRHGFAGVRTMIHDEAETVHQVELLRDPPGDEEQVAEYRLILGRRFADARYHFFGDNQQMHRRLWLDIVEDDTQVVLVLDFRWDFAVDDFLEDGFWHDEAQAGRLGADELFRSQKARN